MTHNPFSTANRARSEILLVTVRSVRRPPEFLMLISQDHDAPDCPDLGGWPPRSPVLFRVLSPKHNQKIRQEVL
ncbi:hypothetical protein CEXT_416101 [Caerostris extrusa]|uniref:Uncharacterized protein n=1 Tax=Caerostris extrusa TaxID=172846 RepID=A0AAV4N008_CAEEX|nr:hypothetical protein CEXT_416101 [Caerostris extrusa]